MSAWTQKYLFPEVEPESSAGDGSDCQAGEATPQPSARARRPPVISRFRVALHRVRRRISDGLASLFPSLCLDSLGGTGGTGRTGPAVEIGSTRKAMSREEKRHARRMNELADLPEALLTAVELNELDEYFGQLVEQGSTEVQSSWEAKDWKEVRRNYVKDNGVRVPLMSERLFFGDAGLGSGDTDE